MNLEKRARDEIMAERGVNIEDQAAVKSQDEMVAEALALKESASQNEKQKVEKGKVNSKVLHRVQGSSKQSGL